MWALVVSINNTEILDKLYPLFISDASILYQINSEMETLIFMFEKEEIHEELIEDGAWNDMINQIDGFKMRISNIVNLEINTDNIHSLLDKCSKYKIR